MSTSMKHEVLFIRFHLSIDLRLISLFLLLPFSNLVSPMPPRRPMAVDIITTIASMAATISSDRQTAAEVAATTRTV